MTNAPLEEGPVTNPVLNYYKALARAYATETGEGYASARAKVAAAHDEGLLPYQSGDTAITNGIKTLLHRDGEDPNRIQSAALSAMLTVTRDPRDEQIHALNGAYEAVTMGPVLLYIAHPDKHTLRYVFADGHVAHGRRAALTYIELLWEDIRAGFRNIEGEFRLNHDLVQWLQLVEAGRVETILSRGLDADDDVDESFFGPVQETRLDDRPISPEKATGAGLRWLRRHGYINIGYADMEHPTVKATLTSKGVTALERVPPVRPLRAM